MKRVLKEMTKMERQRAGYFSPMELSYWAGVDVSNAIGAGEIPPPSHLIGHKKYFYAEEILQFLADRKRKIVGANDFSFLDAKRAELGVTI